MKPLRSFLLLTCAAGFVFAGGCKPSSSSSAVADDAAAAPVAKAAPDAGASASAVSEASVRSVLDAWLAAQNSASFSEYEALYAPRFEGVRRSGKQTARLDRARWMKEREAMFKQKTTVTAKDVVIHTTHDSATVTFVQTWVSDSYRDEGPKRMVLAKTDDKLLIAREEMLSSTVVAPGALPVEKFAFAVHVPGAHLVLHTSPKDEWSKGAPTTVSLGEPVTTRKDVDSLPAELAAWSGKKVELFGKSGIVCEGTIGKLSVIGRVTPHFGTKDWWTGRADGPKPPPEKVASEAWELSAGHGESGRAVVGEVRAEKGDCKGAMWGRAVESDKPVVVEARAADAATRTLALAELRKTRAYTDLQREYKSQKAPGDPAVWEDFNPKVTALVFAHPTGGTIVTLAIRSGAGCGTFEGALTAVWEQKDKQLVPIVEAPLGEELTPASAGDVDGDGRLDLLLKETLLRSKGNKLEAPRKLVVPMLDCPC